MLFAFLSYSRALIVQYFIGAKDMRGRFQDKSPILSLLTRTGWKFLNLSSKLEYCFIHLVSLKSYTKMINSIFLHCSVFIPLLKTRYYPAWNQTHILFLSPQFTSIQSSSLKKFLFIILIFLFNFRIKNIFAASVPLLTLFLICYKLYIFALFIKTELFQHLYNNMQKHPLFSTFLLIALYC